VGRWAGRRVGRQGSDARAVRCVRSVPTEASKTAARAVTAAPDAVSERPAAWDCGGFPHPAAAGADPTKSCPDAVRREHRRELPAVRCGTSARRACAAWPEWPEPPAMRQQLAEAQAGPGWTGVEPPRPASAVSPLPQQPSPRVHAASAMRPARPDAGCRGRPAGTAAEPEPAPSPRAAQARAEAEAPAPDAPVPWGPVAPRSASWAPPQPPEHVAPHASPGAEEWESTGRPGRHGAVRRERPEAAGSGAAVGPDAPWPSRAEVEPALPAPAARPAA
jgi:hypothetical protein